MEIIKDYPCNAGNFSVSSDRTIEYIVIHYVGATGTALQNAQYFMNNSAAGASAHYFVGHESENGAVYQSVEDKNRAWHCGANVYKHPYCRNQNSIGIEMCCHKDDGGNWYFDDITIENTALLTKELMAKYEVGTDNILRHYDVTGKNCPAPFVEDEAAWEGFKAKLSDNEEDEMASIIEQIAKSAGKTADEVIEALGVLVKFANVKEDDWEKEGVDKLKNMGVINSDHDARELIGFGSFGVMLERFKKLL